MPDKIASKFGEAITDPAILDRLNKKSSANFGDKVSDPKIVQRLNEASNKQPRPDDASVISQQDNTTKPDLQTSGQFIKGLLSGQPQENNNAVTTAPQHQQTIKDEIDKGVNYVQQQANEILPYLQKYPELSKNIGNPQEIIQKIVDRQGNPEALGMFSHSITTALNDKYNTRIADIQNSDLGNTDEGQQQVRDLYVQQEKEKRQLQQTVYPLAQLKASNQFVNDYTPGKTITPQELLKIGIATAHGAGVDDVKDLQRNYDNFRLTPQERLKFEKEGGHALEYKISELLTSGKKEEAVALNDDLGNYVRKSLDDNPEARKEAVINAISNEIYKNVDAYSGGNPIGMFKHEYLLDDAVQRAGEKLGLEPKDYADITTKDIKEVPNVVQSFAKGVYGTTVNPILNAVGRLNPQMKGADLGGDIVQPYLDKHFFGGESPNASSLFGPQTTIATDKDNDNYLEQVPNPESGKLNISTRNVPSLIANGLGGLAGFIGGAGETSEILKGAGIVNDATKAEKYGTGMFTYLSGIDENSKTAREEIKGNTPADAAKRFLYANLLSAGDILGMELVNPLGVKGKIFGEGTDARKMLIDIVKNDGLDGLKKNPELLAAAFKKGFEEFGITQGKMTGGMTAAQLAHYWTDRFLAPEKYAREDNATNLMQSMASNAMINMLPSMGAGIGSFNNMRAIQKGASYEVGNNPETYLRAIDQLQQDGHLDEQTANNRRASIHELSDIVQNEVPKTSPETGKELTPVQQQDYTTNLYQERQLNKRIETIKDNVQKGILEKQVEKLQEARAKMLGVPVEDLEDNTNSNQPKKTDNEKQIQPNAEGQQQGATSAASEDNGSDKGSKKSEERVLPATETANSGEGQKKPDEPAPHDENGLPEGRDVAAEYHAQLIDERAKLLQMRGKEKTPEYIAQQEKIATLQQQEKDAIKANERAQELLDKRKNIVNPNTVENEKTSRQAGQEAQQQETSADAQKGNEGENENGQRQGRLLKTAGVPEEKNTEGAPVKKTTPIVEPQNTEQNATTEKSQQQQEGDQQGGEREHKGTTQQRNEATQQQADNRYSNIGSEKEKEKITALTDLHDQVVEARAKELRMRMDKKTATPEYKENSAKLKTLEAQEVADRKEVDKLATEPQVAAEEPQPKVSISEQQPEPVNPKENAPEEKSNWYNNHQLTKSNKYSKYLSAETYKDIWGEGDSETVAATAGELHLMKQDGQEMVDNAKKEYGDKPEAYAINMLNDMKESRGGSSNKKIIATGMLIANLKQEQANNPASSAKIKKLLNPIQDYYMGLMREQSHGLNAGRLMRIFRDENLGNVYSERILTEKQEKAKKALEDTKNITAVPEDIAEKGTLRTKKEVATEKQTEKEAKPPKETRPRKKENEYAKKLEEKKKTAGDKADIIQKLKDEIKKRC